ncbi:MAG: periplasmic heavy metal sensor, partial [candidate division WOR-3 bacterium]
SPEQKAKIEEVRIETRKDIIPIKSQIELKQIDLHKEMKADNPNKDKILKLSQEIHNLEWQIKKLHIEEKLKIHSLLTPEQRAKLKIPKKKFIKKIEIEREDKD